MYNPDHFTYHAPNPRTAPKYEAIRQAEAKALRWFVDGEASYDAVNAVMAEYAQVLVGPQHWDYNAGPVLAICPHSHPDTQRAYDLIRLARNAANEAIATGITHEYGVVADPRLMAIARSKLQESRWLACGVVALEDVANQQLEARIAAHYGKPSEPMEMLRIQFEDGTPVTEDNMEDVFSAPDYSGIK